MSKKKDAPPRPPAPKLTLNKLSGRQGSVGSISVHYNPSMDNSSGELDEDVVFDPGTSSDMAPVSIQSKARLRQQQQQSRSAPSSEATTPVSNNQKLIGQSSLDQGLQRPTQDVAQLRESSEKSLLSGLRNKLNDFPNAFIEKIENISSDTVFADVVDKKMKTSDSMDSTRSFGGTSPLDVTSSHMTDARKNLTPTSDGPTIEEAFTPTNALFLDGATRRNVFVANGRLDSQNKESKTMEWHRMDDVERTGITKSPAHDHMFSPKTNIDDKTPMTLSGLLTRVDSIDDIPSSESDTAFYDAEDLPQASATAKVAQKRQNMVREEHTWHLQKIVAAVVCVLAYLVVPLPSFVLGLLSGITVTICVIKLHKFLTQQSCPKKPFVVPNLDSQPPMPIPETRESKNEEGKFKGWMNELSKYDVDEYHINQTQSVFVQLEGASLRLQRASSHIPKRAMWNEPQHNSVTFTPHQRFFTLTDAQVSLLPKGIISKRLWSKKYPILIELVTSQQDSPSLDDLGEPNVSIEDLNVSTSDPAVHRLYLFARTPREKEEWYWRFVAAATGHPLPTKMAELLVKLTTPKSRAASQSSPDAVTKKQFDLNDLDNDSIVSLNEDSLLAYLKYMADIMPMKQHGIPGPGKGLRLCEPNLLFLNAFIARLFWDFLREKYWAGKIQTKIQKKLSKIHVPYFIDELTVTGVEIGSEIPVIRRSTQPFLNDRGLWADLDITYNGGFRMCLETKVNLMKLKKISSNGSFVVEDDNTKYTKGSAVLNSDEEDSGESSTDEEGNVEEKLTAETPDDKAGGKGKKLLRFVDKIAQSKYFQQVAEYKYIRKAMEEVSNTRLVLTVELKSLSGTLAINIPPPPTDRLWYGFRTNPRLWLSAKPRVGDREVNVSHITDWIEKKLATEFERVFVMPNMDDLVIPLMCSHMYDCQTKSQTNDTTAAR